MLDLGRAVETGPDELAPFGEIGRVAEVDGVAFEAFPFDEEAIALRMLDRAFKPHPLAALCSLKDRHGTAHAVLELGFGPGLHRQPGGLENHAGLLALAMDAVAHPPSRDA